MNKFSRNYLILMTVFAMIWMGILGTAYRQVTQHDDFRAEEIHSHAKHTAIQIEELFKWFEEKQRVFVPAALSEIKAPTKDSSIITSDGQVFTISLPIEMVGRIKNQIQDGVKVSFISNNPLNPKNGASSRANIALISALESDSLDYFYLDENKNEFRYLKPLITTKSCLICHTNASEGDLIGAVVIDIDPAEFTHDAELEANSTNLIMIGASSIVLLAFYVLGFYMLRKYKHHFNNIQYSQQMTTNMSQEIELALGNLGHILNELKRDGFDNDRKDGLIRSLQTINNDLLNTSFKVQVGGENLRQQEEIFHVEDLFNNCMQVYDEQCTQKNLSFKLHMDISVPTYLLGNAYYLRQILVRLFKFSISYTNKGSVNVRVSTTTNLSSRFHIKDLNNLPIHLVVEVEDTGIGYVVTDKQHLLQNFAKMDYSGTRLKTRPVISLTPINDIATLLDGSVNMLHNSKNGSCFKLIVQMKLIEKGITPRSDAKAKLETARDVLSLDTAQQEVQTLPQKATISTLPPLDKELSIILADSDYETIPQENIDIWRKEKLNVTLIRNSAEGVALVDKPKHGFSVIFLRKLADIDIIYAATRLRYIEQTRPDNPSVAIVLIADELLRTDMEALRFFNISSVDHVPRDPYTIVKLTRLALLTHKNKVFHGDTVFDETAMKESKDKYFDINMAIKKSKNDKQLLNSICSMWIRFYPTQIERIQHMSKENDSESHLRLIRSIKNSATTVSLPMLWAEADRLEKRLLSNEEIRYEKLLSIYEKTYDYIKEHFG